MDAEKFLKEWRRMCQTKDNCSQCGGDIFVCVCNACADSRSDEDIANLAHAVITWSETQLVKTRLMDFNEKFPDFAKRLPNGYPEYLPWVFGYCGRHKSFPCAGCKRESNPIDCWDMPMEEE